MSIGTYTGNCVTHNLIACLWRPPSDFGKTTLVIYWLKTFDWPSAWLSLNKKAGNLAVCNIEIATKLVISPGTVRQHNHNIYQKLRANILVLYAGQLPKKLLEKPGKIKLPRPRSNTPAIE